jgi:hypothetical protein
MTIRISGTIFLAMLCCECLGQGREPLTFDGLVQEPAALEGMPMAVQFLNGITVKDSELVSFLQDRRTKAIQFVQYKDGGRKPKKKAEEVYRMIINQVPYRLRFHQPSMGYYLIDELVSVNKVKSRLEAKEASFRHIAAEDETQAAVMKQKSFFDDAIKSLSNPALRTYESKFSLLMTDYPAPIAGRVGQYVDDLCVQMNKLNGIPVDANIWEGKVMVALFSNQPLFGAYQINAMKNPNFGASTIIYHNQSDKFMVSCHAKQLNSSLARRICWGVAGGYVARYRSNVKMPEWLRVGTREWVTTNMFPNRSKQKSKFAQIAKSLSRTRSLLGILSAEELDDNRIDTALLLVSHLANQNSGAFGQFFQDIKAGHEFEDALITNYGVTPNQLAASFGASFGVANVVP